MTNHFHFCVPAPIGFFPLEHCKGLEALSRFSKKDDKKENGFCMASEERYGSLFDILAISAVSAQCSVFFN